ncbi:MAG: methionine--tRNA ligase [Candidatus Zambryskibacteria bacterium RIFCSPHIGHO2_01_FULL_49_18]|uniref:Methionine--tRNA ligase n=2 Tax=Candidatus Zambryskiibacteriota TaxID=1817925 RepID=A0A1G2T2L1_9BACT|nr:MAG: methionine--tRNA ligase [Candidatus Zambryskibacteria bacterium RIFCSPHIGHO2_01_FULL_49_18]OHB05695.1 MAG: methionine--tRNA ligase [Candidatus Zambryskibacteria bacterium RIFCSPLOWO2_01_FULL_47_14]
MDKKSFYITTTIPYVNADPHIGFALELVQSDAIARYRRLIGEEVFFSTGTDEYGQKIWEGSQKENKDVKDYVDYYAEKFIDLAKKLNLSNDNFIRTTSDANIKAAQEFWKLCDQNGDIYKKKYKGLYCVGCEKFLTEKDFVDGKCVFHPNLVPEMIEEENYFFKLSKYREKLLEYLSQENVILPEWRRKEALEYVQGAMDDFSISRSKERLAWGIAIPGDDTQVMYVWFGAFINYIATLGWPQNNVLFEKFWQGGTTVQTAGKDMVKFQSVMWQGMLMSAGLKATDYIVYHGFVTGEGGVKMSKSLGNVISPLDIVEEYGTDALRYFLLREISSFEDSPFTIERFKDAYNSGLANGLGNLVSRIMTLAESNLDKPTEIAEWEDLSEYLDLLNKFEVNLAANYVWNKIGALDREIQEKKPWESKDKDIISGLVQKLYSIARMLNPLMPETSAKIKELIKVNKKPEVPLFLRK